MEYEKAVLVGLITQYQDTAQVHEYLDELAFLAETAGAMEVKRFTQKLTTPDRRTFVGTGKLSEISSYTKDNEINLVIFDDDLSPSQKRNIEAEITCKVMDRTSLILDIFASRAKTSYAKVQVELAQCQYMLPRLTGMWTHLERQKGGIGLRGPGETEIETDRRVIRDRISKLKDDLEKIDRQKVQQRKQRGQMVRVALIGYTNVGKSTIMNLISKSDILAENKLFATLDTTVRKVVFENLPFLLSDTVGFIRKLPHNLIESFKSTLDELRESDILLHVIDISHPGFEEQISVVNNTLKEIGASDKLIIQVFNKIDNFKYIKKDEDDLTPSTKENISLEDLQNTWMNKNEHRSIFISATDNRNINEFKTLLYDEIKAMHIKRYPYNNLLY